MNTYPLSYIQPDDDPLDIRKDNVFKAVFTKDTPESMGALSRLVSALIDRNVTIVSMLANEPPFGNTRDRQVRFDINCRAENGELVNVEMCFNPMPFEPVRMEFYAAKLFTGQDIKGTDKNFNDLKQAYQIAILAKYKFFQDEIFLHNFAYYDSVNRIPLNGRTRIITLELSKLAAIAEKPSREMSVSELWAVYFAYLTDSSKRGKINEIVELEEGIAMASSVLMTVSRDEEERARIMRDEKIELDWQSYMSWAKKEGHSQGLAEGRAEGRAEGIEQEREESHEYFLKLLDQGLSVDEIKQQLQHRKEVVSG